MGRSTSPASNRIFKVRPEDERKILDEERAKILHHMVAQLIFFASRVSKDIKIAIAFLCTLVRSLGMDYWEKLVRVLRYTIVTLHLPLILRADNLSVIKWLVDTSFAEHPD